MDTWLTEDDIVARFQREVRLLADELSHPNIITVITRNVSASPPWFAMPLCSSTLTKELAAGQAGKTVWVATVFRQVLDGMQYAHSRDVIHRDLKPQNILFDGPVVKISDFGLSKYLGGDTALTKSRMWAGTEPYMAPEQFTDMKNAGKEADVFALGKLLYEMLTGTTPPVGAIDAGTLPEPFRYFVQRACDLKPENRFRDAGEALTTFDRLTTGSVTALPLDEELASLAAEWFTTLPGKRLDVVRKVEELLRLHADDEELFTTQVPNLPADLVAQFQESLPDAFVAVLQIYDGHVSGGLPWSYCDVVAGFYRGVWARTDRLDVFALVLERLIVMGASHNRFYVGDVVAGILHDIKAPSEVEVASDVIRRNPGHRQWFRDQVMRIGVTPQIAAAFDA